MAYQSVEKPIILVDAELCSVIAKSILATSSLTLTPLKRLGSRLFTNASKNVTKTSMMELFCENRAKSC